MTLQTSGPISTEDISNEYGGSRPDAISEYLRGGSLVPDTAANASIPTTASNVAFNDYYGGSSAPATTPFTWTINYSANALRADIDGVNAGWDGAGHLTIIISAGVYIYNSAPSGNNVHGLLVTGVNTGGCTIYNYGYMVGAGGNGGDANSSSLQNLGGYTNVNGGSASGVGPLWILAHNNKVTVYNYGYIAGGGGGGGGGSNLKLAAGGGGAGGGRGGNSIDTSLTSILHGGNGGAIGQAGVTPSGGVANGTGSGTFSNTLGQGGSAGGSGSGSTGSANRGTSSGGGGGGRQIPGTGVNALIPNGSGDDWPGGYGGGPNQIGGDWGYPYHTNPTGTGGSGRNTSHLTGSGGGGWGADGGDSDTWPGGVGGTGGPAVYYIDTSGGGGSYTMVNYGTIYGTY